MKHTFRIEQADWERHRDTLLGIRFTVFVDEQGVPPELEHDGHDALAQHLLAYAPDGTAVGTGRTLSDGQIGRMAVLPEWRGRGIGSLLLRELIALAAARGMNEVFLHAQCRAEPFYARAGFEPHGGIFDDAGIDHRCMRRPVSG